MKEILKIRSQIENLPLVEEGDPSYYSVLDMVQTLKVMMADHMMEVIDLAELDNPIILLKKND